MPIYSLSSNGITPVARTPFSQLGVTERGELQRLLRDKIEVISEDTLVIAEEFGDWDRSRRRIDLLAVDKGGNIVVIELKRTEDGGHMELQAVRYAAMVSTMTFEQAVRAFTRYLHDRGDSRDARETLLEFLDWNEPSDDFGTQIRIVLASAEFAPELTTAVLWLNDQGLDIRCVRITPHGTPGNVLLEVQQVVPLPEAADYSVRVREKHRHDRAARSAKETTKFDVTIAGVLHQRMAKNRSIHALVKHLMASGVTEEDIRTAIPWRKKLVLSVDGAVKSEEFLAKVAEQETHFDPRRWFNNDDELIHAHGRTYAASNQWGHRTEEALRDIVQAIQPEEFSFVRSP